MESILKAIASPFDLEVSKAGVGWQLALPMRSGYTCVLDIGPDALDWYASISEATDELVVYKDWMDYLGYDSRAEFELIREKGTDLMWFVGSWMNCQAIRVRPDLSLDHSQKRIAEWSHGDQWRKIQLCDSGE